MSQIPAEMNTETTSNSNYVNSLTELKLMIATLEAKNQTLQGKVENLELKAENRALKEDAEQKANYQALEAKVNEFPKMLAEQQKQMSAQFQASLEQKLKEAEQRAQMEKNELEEIIQANQQKMEKFHKEMDKNGQQSSGSNLNKLDYMWTWLMSKSKILANPKGLVWDPTKTNANISECGLKATDFDDWVFATEGYAISGEHFRKENFQFPGPILCYYEVTIRDENFAFSSVGFTDGSKPAGRCVGFSSNSYGIVGYGAENYSLWLSGKEHELEFPTGVIADRDVLGSGLLLNSKNELAVFFTRNGILLGNQIRINPTVDRLFPTVYIDCISVEANFGDNIAVKPFKFDTDKCPGLVFE